MDFTLHSCKITSNSLDSFIMYRCLPQQGLALANELVAEGCTTFTFGEMEKRRIVSRGGTERRTTSHCLSKRPLRERPVGSPDSVHSGRGRTPDSYQVALRLAAASCYRIARENWGGAHAVGSIPHLRSASRRPGCGKASAARRRDRGIGGGFRRGRLRTGRGDSHGLCPSVGLVSGAAAAGFARRRPGIGTTPGFPPTHQAHHCGSRSRTRNR